MTINEYFEKLRELPTQSKDGKDIADIMANVAQIWDNAACEGYCVAAMREAGIEEADRERILTALRKELEMLTVDQARKIVQTRTGK